MPLTRLVVVKWTCWPLKCGDPLDALPPANGQKPPDCSPVTANRPNRTDSMRGHGWRCPNNSFAGLLRGLSFDFDRNSGSSCQMLRVEGANRLFPRLNNRYGAVTASRSQEARHEASLHHAFPLLTAGSRSGRGQTAPTSRSRSRTESQPNAKEFFLLFSLRITHSRREDATNKRQSLAGPRGRAERASYKIGATHSRNPHLTTTQQLIHFPSHSLASSQPPILQQIPTLAAASGNRSTKVVPRRSPAPPERRRGEPSLHLRRRYPPRRERTTRLLRLRG
jgi:hypothetical protein